MTGKTEVLAISCYEYTRNHNVPMIHLFGRTADKERKHIKVRGFDPRMYAIDNERNRNFKHGKIKSIKPCSIKTMKGDPTLEIITELPSDIPNIRDLFGVHYQADILFNQVFKNHTKIISGVEFTDLDMNVNDLKPVDVVDGNLRLNIGDIEVDPRQVLPRMPNAVTTACPIIALTIYDNYLDKMVTFALKSPSCKYPLGVTKSKIKSRLYESSDEYIRGLAREFDWTIIIFNDEKKLLMKFVEFVKDVDPDVFTGWNFDKFDMQYILNRMKKLRIDRTGLSPLGYINHRPGMLPRIPGRITFDMLKGYKRIIPKELNSYRLEVVAQEEFKIGKLPYEGNVGDLWERDFQKFIEYNVGDVDLCYYLELLRKPVKYHYAISRQSGVSFEVAHLPNMVNDAYILLKANDKFILPSKIRHKKKTPVGGAVFTPTKGIEDICFVFDFEKLYPRALQTLNAGLDTKVEHEDLDKYDKKDLIHAKNDSYYRKDKVSFNVDVLNEFIDIRNEMKRTRDTFKEDTIEYENWDDEQFAYKQLTNSYIGNLGYSGSRLLDYDVFEAVTVTCQYIINYLKDVLEDIKFKVIYGDTDSVFVSIKRKGRSIKELVELGHMIAGMINEVFWKVAEELNVDKHYFKVEFEKIYENFFMTEAKKRYAGILRWKSGNETMKVDIIGFDTVRSDNSKVSKDVQKEVIEMLVCGKKFKEIREYVVKEIRKVENGEYSLDEIGIPMGITKPLLSYNSPDAHIRGALYANSEFGTSIGADSKPKRVYIYSTPRGYPPTDVISFEWEEQVPVGFIPDYKIMAEKLIRDKVDKILDAVGYSWMSVKTGLIQSTLFGPGGDGISESKDTMFKKPKRPKPKIKHGRTLFKM